MPTVPKVPFFTLAPDWLCEVLSPRTETLDRTRKLPIYARAGVLHVWLIDPLKRTLEVLRLEQQSWAPVASYSGDMKVRAEPLDAAEIDLLPLWGETRQQP